MNTYVSMYRVFKKEGVKVNGYYTPKWTFDKLHRTSQKLSYKLNYKAQKELPRIHILCRKIIETDANK